MQHLPEKKDATVNARIRASLKQRMRDIWREYRISESDLIDVGLDAICAYIEEEKRFRLPVRMVYDHETAELRKMLVAEQAAGHTAAAAAIQKRLESQLRTGAPGSSHASRGAQK